MTGNSEKATHYISLLDAARVNASWSELPELIRKVTKHAPQRKTLVQTATAEHDVATSSGSLSTSLTTLSNTLHSSNEQGTEDIFQGKTCLLWSRWTAPEEKPATAGFDIITAVKELEGKSVTTWTKICIVKSAYIEGTNYLRNGRPSEARKVFDAALSNMQSNRELVLSTPQLAYWAEQLLAQLAFASYKHAVPTIVETSQIEVLKYWGVIASKTKRVPASTYGNSSSHRSRLSVWKMYYEILSIAILQQERETSTSTDANRVQLSNEIRKVERAYENELLAVTKFPNANETNAAMEQWVEEAVRNWQVLCGSSWSDTELGEGGRNAVARNMLDILYRAATKTFHSTLILRRLFQVHLSLSEFDLAYRAFDTYIELVDRGRIRVAKSKKPEPGHESDTAVLSTISEAICGLCKFGGRSEARKAYELCLKLEDWLATIGVEDSEVEGGQDLQNGHLDETSTSVAPNSKLLQAVYRAIGTSKANWARWTPASENRSNLQNEGLIALRKACFQGEPEIETLYATSLLLAETRNITSAIQIAKQALAKSTSSGLQSTNWATERKLVSQWHLLALLLSSRQDFDSATKSCVAAFEQFATGELHLGPGRNSSVSSDIEKQFRSAVSSFAAEMECDELQRIIEVRITELALTELMDGPEEAVNSSNELLSLFSRLFAHTQISLDSSTVGRSLVPPKSSAGTVKSSRMSMFGRKKHESPTVPLNGKGNDVASMTTNTTRPSTRATQAPRIQVTSEDNKPASKGSHLRKSYDSSHSKSTVDGGHKKLSHRLTHRDHEKHSQTTSEKQGTTTVPVQTNTAQASLPAPDHEAIMIPAIPLEHEKSMDSKQELPEVRHNLALHDSVPPPASHKDQPPQQDARLPTVHSFTNTTSPPPRLSKTAIQRQALTILVKVWLVIATLYRRANMFEDSKEACEEASKAATKIEGIVGAVDHSARAFAEAGWGAGNRSSDEVWADIYCERAELQLAVYKQKVKGGSQVNNEDIRTVVDQYEQCLMYMPNHPAGIVGLSNVLLDSYEKKVDLGRRVNDGRLQLVEQEPVPSIVVTTEAATQTANGTHSSRSSLGGPTDHQASSRADEDLKKTPENLNRIAARDRAYGLLSTLTKLGSGWDDSAAWFALARAHELGGEIEKAKSILWWCVELEDTKPIRHWRNLGYSL